jgi:protein O-mannosyl-transferase
MQPRSPSHYLREMLIALALFLLVFACYWPVVHYGFINYDDPLYVVDNVHVRGGWSIDGLLWSFRDFSSSNWHPLTWLSHMTDWQLFRDNAGGHHMMNVLLHAINAMILFALLRLMTGACWRSACVAALFAVHPLNVESVAWVAERKNVLSTGFGLLTLLSYALYLRRPGWKRYLPVLGTFAMGLMAKPMLVTLPFLLLLVDCWPESRFTGKFTAGERLPIPGAVGPRPNPPSSLSVLLLEKVPLLLLSSVSIILTLLAAEKGGALKTLDHFSLNTRLANSLHAYGAYIGKFFWPHDLAVFYPHPGILPTWQTAGTALLMLAATVFALMRLKQYPYLAVGWFWFLGTLVPVIGMVQVGLQAMADRYLYFPMIGLLIMLIWWAADLCKPWVRGKTAGIFILVIVVSTAALWTRQQLQYWQNSRMLFEHALAVTGANPITSSNLAHALFGEGDWKGAEAHYREAIRSDPKYSNAYANLGTVLAREGRIAEAIGEYRKALALNPRHAAALHHLGLAMESQKSFLEADADSIDALRIKPDYPDPLQKILDCNRH